MCPVWHSSPMRWYSLPACWHSLPACWRSFPACWHSFPACWHSFGFGLDVDRIWFLSAAPKQAPQQGLIRTPAAPKPGSRISKPGSKILPIQGRKSFDPGFDPGFGGSTLDSTRDSTLDSMVRPWIRPGKPGSKNCSTLVSGGSTLVSTLDSTLDLVSTLDSRPWFRLFDPGLELQIQGRSN